MNRKFSNNPEGPKRPKTARRSDVVHESVHRRNFRMVAMPITCIMGILRLIALQLWIIITFLWIKLPNSKESDSETSSMETESISDPTPATLAQNESFVSDIFCEKRQAVGAGEPALAKQKHHHRRAFEFISKALKLDEEDEGEPTSLILKIPNLLIPQLES